MTKNIAQDCAGGPISAVIDTYTHMEMDAIDGDNETTHEEPPH